jgi:hypothetical protein
MGRMAEQTHVFLVLARKLKIWLRATAFALHEANDALLAVKVEAGGIGSNCFVALYPQAIAVVECTGVFSPRSEDAVLKIQQRVKLCKITVLSCGARR